MGDMRSTRWCACSRSVVEEGEEEAEEEEEEAVAGGGRGMGLPVMVGFGGELWSWAGLDLHARSGVGEPACLAAADGSGGRTRRDPVGGGWRRRRVSGMNK